MPTSEWHSLMKRAAATYATPEEAEAARPCHIPGVSPYEVATRKYRCGHHADADAWMLEGSDDGPG